MRHPAKFSNTTEWLFLILYYGLCELAPLMLQLDTNRDNRFYYNKRIANKI